MNRRAQTRVLRQALAIGALVLLAPMMAWTCSVPVFRYALERWTADPFEVVVFHRGPLSAADQEMLAPFQPPEDAPPHPANIAITTVDLDANPSPAMLNLWESQSTESLPWMTVLFPAPAGIARTFWSGSFSEANLSHLTDSPARKEITRRLTTEDSAVWVHLEIGDEAKDAAAAKLLQERLAYLEKELELPELDESDIRNGLVSVTQEDLKVSFSSMTLKRDDPKEAVFTRMLLGTESDLNDLKESMVFPIFGRGRALYALVGAGINTDTIDEAASFLIGPCSCQVKEQNPGVDLLMSAVWDNLIKSTIDRERDLPPLSGFVGLGPEAEKGPEDPGTETPNPPATTNAPPPAALLPPQMAVGIMGRLLTVGLIALVIIGGITAVLIFRK